MAHTACQEMQDGKNVDWMEKVTDQEHKSAPQQAERIGRKIAGSINATRLPRRIINRAYTLLNDNTEREGNP
jgi:hypothetical protein